MRFSIIATATAAALYAGATHAAVIVNIQEVGADVIISYSGAIDLTDTAFDGTKPAEAFGAFPILGVIGNLTDPYTKYLFPSAGVTPHGPGNGALGSSRTGDIFGFSDSAVGLSVGYVSGAAINGSLTFAAASLLSLGFTPGSYVTTLPNDAITTNVIGADVPLPAAAPMLLGALALTGVAARRRKG